MEAPRVVLGGLTRRGYAADIIVGLPNSEDRAKSYIGKLAAGRYRLDCLLGVGALSAVFRASDLEAKAFAVKVLYPELLANEAQSSFERESKLIAEFSQPHIVPIICSGWEEALGHYLVMPLLSGRDLDGVLEVHGALAPESAVRIALQAASGLAAAHQLGVVHRNVKPGNVLLDRDGSEVVVRISEFGIARRLDAGEARSSETSADLGWLDYVAPEQLHDEGEVDARTDVWGLGATLYQMLCGVAPFSHVESSADLATAIGHEDAPPIQDRAPWIEAGLSRAVHRALQRDPELRPATIQEFADLLGDFAGGAETLDESRITRVSTEMRQRVESRAESPPAPVARPGASELDPLGLIRKHLDDRYLVLRPIGKGGMGSVYEVEGPNGECLAAKVISTGMAHASPNALERFAREAHMASDIESPNVARTIETGTDQALGMPYIIMELLRGLELSSVLKKEGALEPQVAVRLVLQAASGVGAAHARGILHRDLKPANLFLQIDEQTEEVTVKVCDFGVPKHAANNHNPARSSSLLGSPMYMSPEQAKSGRSVDARSDVWSLSVVLWEALSGQRLWGGQTSLGELIVAICTEPILQLDAVAAWVPRDLARVVHRGLERDRNLRPDSMQAFIESLSVFSGGSDRVQKSQLVAMTMAQRGSLQMKVSISASAAAGMANLARGGRGGTSLPPERIGGPRRSATPEGEGTAANAWPKALLLIVVVGGLVVLLAYMMDKL